MKRALLAAAVLLAAAPARAWFGSNSPAKRLTIEREFYAAGRYAEVVAALTPERLQKLRKTERRDGYLMLAESYERLGAPDKAVGVYELAVRLFPKDLPLLTQLGWLLHRSELPEQARPMFARVLAIHPNNAASHVGLAEIDAKLGFLDRSAQYYERALESMSESPEVWRDYAEVLLKRRDHKTALLAAERSLKLKRDPETLFVLAQILRAEGRMDEALARVDEACASGWSRAAAARLAKSLWLLEAGRYDDAAALAEAALAIDPEEPLALWVRARVALKRDRHNAAVRDLEAAAAQFKRAPFVAKAAQALLTRLKEPR